MPAAAARFVLSLSLALAAAPLAVAATGNVDLPRFPAISPDGKQVTFSWRGDIWKVPSAGGVAVRLTSNPATETRSAWSADGKLIAFTSTRLGGVNLFVMNADGTGVRPLTQSDRRMELAGFTPDGARVLFSSSREGDVYRAPRPYYVPVEGGTPERLMDCFGDFPAMSPDGARIAFERGTSEWSRRNYKGPDNRDLYLYDVKAKTFSRLTSYDGNDGKAHWRDDSTLVFLSDRELSATNLYQMKLGDTGGSGGNPEQKARRLTSFEGQDVVDFDVSRDGGTCVFQVWDTLYTINLRQGDPKPAALTINAPEDEADNFQIKSVSKDVSEAELSPDGKTLAVVAYGQVYIRATEEKAPTRRVTTGPAGAARARDLAWSPDNAKLYFSSDADGGLGIYAATVEATRDEVREEVKKLDEAAKAAADKPKADADAAPKEEAKKDDAKDEKKPDDKKTDPSKQGERWAKAIRFKIDPVNTGRKPGLGGDNDRNPSPSPDGKTLAFRRSRGDIMLLDLAAATTRRLVESWDYQDDWRWSPDSRFIAYSTSDNNFNTDIWIIRADGSKPAVNITRSPSQDLEPRWSADGKVLAFLSDRIDAQMDVWSVYLDADLDSYTREDLDKYYKDAVDAAKKRVPLGAKKKDDKKDEKKEEKKDDKKAADAPAKDDAKADKPAEPKPDADAKDKPKDEKKADDKKTEEKKPEPPPFEPSLDDAYLRVRRITSLAGPETNLELTPGGDRYIFTGNDKGDGGAGLYSVKWTGEDKERKRLAEGAGISVMGVSLTGDKVLYISGGAASTVPPDGGKAEALPIDDKQRIDLQKFAVEKFTEAARQLGETFYHPTMRGLDWPAVSKKYLQLAAQSRTKEEFGSIGMRLIGELNASHLGVYPPAEDLPGAETSGRLGVDARPAMSPGRVFIVAAVVPRGPCAKGPMALKHGDIITAIDFEPFAPTDSLDSRLRGKVGKEVTLTVKRGAEAARESLDVLATPISYDAETTLRYDWWCKRNAEEVAKISGGKIGYLHIRSMGEESLVDFERDLYAAADGKEGLLIDVRNNGGGWTADRVLASIMVQPHAYTVPRGGSVHTDAYPRDRLYIQRYTKPVNMLCNEKSFSNAEIISHAFKTLKRGNLCGQQTYGGVISTDAFNLLDGTLVRIPFRGWFLPDGTDMENHGAMPDVVTIQTPEDEAAGIDRQLKEATEDLMKRIK